MFSVRFEAKPVATLAAPTADIITPTPATDEG
jgi:hypothetical protein